MHRYERWEEVQAAIEAGLDRLQSRMWTKLPCKITAIDKVGNQQVVSVQPLIKLRQTMRDSSGNLTSQDQSWPTLTEVPVKFPSGGGWTLTVPLKVGDEGTISFASRCIDNWWQGGGEQPQVTSNGQGSVRQHHESDGFFELGGRSLPNALQNVSTTSPQLRSDDGQQVLQFDENGLVVTIGGVQVFKVDANGNVTSKGEMTAKADSGNSVTLTGHLTPNITRGSSTSDPPEAGT